MLFIPFEEWMQLTRSMIYSRSEKLKALDAAIWESEAVADDQEILRWHAKTGMMSITPELKAALDLEEKRRAYAVAKVSKAFDDWAGFQASNEHGVQDWRKSVRNSKGAMEKLAGQIKHWKEKYPRLSVDASILSRTGMQILIDARNNSIPALFLDCKVIAYEDNFTKADDFSNKVTAARLARSSGQLHNLGQVSAASGAARAANSSFMRSITTQIDSMVAHAFGSDAAHLVWDQAEHAVRSTVEYAIKQIKDEIAALAPGVGLGVASAGLLFHTVKLVMESVAADSLLDLSKRLEVGDAQAALQRMRDWQLRTIANRAQKVARAGINVGMHAAAIASCGAGIPAQLAVSIANAVVALAAAIGELGMQYKEKRALSVYLKKPDLGREIFATAPLAAAYYLLNTPDSHVALQLVEIGAPGWQADVERLKKDGVLRTMLSTAQDLINEARYRIRRKNGGRFRERLENGFVDKAKDLVRA
jgi:hypothetical protein